MVTKILGVVPDLLFKSKISETAKRTGIEVKYCSAATLAARAAEEQPGLIVIDLNGAAARASCEAVAALRKNNAEVPVVGFVGHVAADMAALAQSSGFTRGLTNGAFTAGCADVHAGKL